MQVLRKEGRWDDLQQLAERVLTSDSLNEEATLALAESIAMSGSKALAIGLLDKFVEDLGGDAHALSLPATVLRRRISEQRQPWIPTHHGAHRLVGRQQCIAAISGALDDASSGRGSALVVCGPAGIGKTRLLQEASLIAGLRGFQCVDLRLDPGSAHRAFSSAAAILLRLKDCQGAASAPPAAFAVTKRVLGDEAHTAARTESSTAVTAQPVAWALSELTRAVSHERRLLITVDDADSLDSDSTAALATLVSQIETCRAMLVIATRQAMAPLSSAGATTLPLPELSHSDARTLAALACANPLSEGAVDRIATLSGGNPLYIRELAALDVSELDSATLPHSLQALIASRLASVTKPQQSLLRATALLAPFATIERLATLCKHSECALHEAIEPLEYDGILRATEAGAIAVHDCWRTAIVSQMGPATLAAMSYECGSILLADAALTENVDALWKAADLLTQGGHTQTAINVLIKVGEDCLSRGLCAQSASAFERALALEPARSSIAQLEERVATAFAAMSDHESAERHATRGIACLAHGGLRDTELRVRLLARLAESVWHSRRSPEDTLESLFASCSLPGTPKAAIDIAGFNAIRLLHSSSSSTLADRFYELLLRHSQAETNGLPFFLGTLIHQLETGRDSQAADTLASLDRISLEGIPEHERILCMRYCLHAHRLLGGITKAFEVGQSAFERAIGSGYPHQAATTAMSLSFLALDEGRLATAREWLNRVPLVEPPAASHGSNELRHLRSRIALQAGDAERAFSELSCWIDSIQADQARSRRLVVLSNLGLAAALSHRKDFASTLLRELAPQLTTVPAASVLDFAAEAVGRGFISLGFHDAGWEVARSYLARRREFTARALPPAYQLLSAASTRPHSISVSECAPGTWLQRD